MSRLHLLLLFGLIPLGSCEYPTSTWELALATAPYGNMPASAAPQPEPRAEPQQPVGERLIVLTADTTEDRKNPLRIADPPESGVPLDLVPRNHAPTGLTVNNGMPRAIINAEPSARRGDQVILDASLSENASSFSWAVIPEGTQGFYPVENGRRAFFSNYNPGFYIFALAVASAEGHSSITMKTIEIVDPSGTMEPQGLTGVVAIAGEVRVWRRAVQSDTLPEDSEKLAQCFETVADYIKGGRIQTPLQALKTTDSLAQKRLLGQYQAWGPFFDLLRERLNMMSQQGKLRNVDEHEILWRDIAAGLRK